MTLKETARIMNVSERSAYNARELMATGRDDLVNLVCNGQMTLAAALREAKPDKYPKQTRVDRFKSIWKASTKEERAELVTWLAEQLQ